MENSKQPAMNSATIVAYGEALWDLLPSGPVLGGAPLNFAYRVNSLGYEGLMISQLGNDTLGNQALQQMIDLEMNTQYIQRTADYPTGTVDVKVDEQGAPDFTIIPDVAYDFIQYSEELDQLIARAECFCFGTVAQRSEVSRNTLAKLLEQFTGQYALFDINLRKDCYTTEVIEASLAKSDILKLNDAEVSVVARIYGIPDQSIPEFTAGLLRKTSLKYCLVTLGGRGAFAASDRGEFVYAPAYKIRVVDSCGAGDAFTAGFLCTLLKNKGLRAACKFGNALGARVAEQHGATQVVTYEDIDRFMRSA